jgi:hypothetical protein
MHHVFSYHQSTNSLMSHPDSNSNPNILLASQSSAFSTKNVTRGPLANKPRTNMIGVGPNQGLSAASRPMLSTHLHTAQALHDTRSLSRLSKASGQPNPSISDAASHPTQNQKRGVCETVEDISESVVFMSNRHHSGEESEAKETPVLHNKYQQRTTMSKNDNKDSRKLPGDISLNELST